MSVYYIGQPWSTANDSTFKLQAIFPEFVTVAAPKAAVSSFSIK